MSWVSRTDHICDCQRFCLSFVFGLRYDVRTILTQTVSRVKVGQGVTPGLDAIFEVLLGCREPGLSSYRVESPSEFSEDSSDVGVELDVPHADSPPPVDVQTLDDQVLEILRY